MLLVCLAPPCHGSCQLVTVKTVNGDPAPNLSARTSYVAAPPSGATVAAEGLAERLSDLLIYDSGSGAACFQNGNVITLTYSAALLSAPGFDIFDSSPSSLAVATQFTSPSIVRITVTHAGTAGNFTSSASGAAIRIKNLRANSSAVASGLNITVLGSATATGTLSGSLRNVGYVARTIAAGAGIRTAGVGSQNAGATLSTPAVFSFSENFADALRAPGSSGVSGDSPSGATSLVLDAANTIPPGVTVTFPPSIVTSGLSFNLRYGGTCSGPAQCFATYDVASNLAAGNATLTLTTAASARTGADGSTPAIGVQIGPNSGIGTVTLRGFFGPGVAGGTNDDVNAGAVPRYIAASLPDVSPTRAIFTGAWFAVAPSAPMLAISPARLAFGSVLVGTGRSDTIVLSNTSTQLLQFGSITASGADFRLDNGCPGALTPLASCVLTVHFSPTAELARSGAVSIVSNAGGSPHEVPLTGEGSVVHAEPVITSLSPSAIQAGNGWTRLVVTGSNFAPGAIVQWNKTGLGTTVVSDTEVAAGVPPGKIATPGTAQITVANPAPGGGTSNPLTFVVFAGPLPTRPYLYYVPHIVSGGGFATRITLVDAGPGANSVTVNYLGQSGALLDTTEQPLANGGALRVEAPGANGFAPVTSQWAVIGADAPLAVNVLIEQQSATGDSRPTGSIGYGDCTPADVFVVPAEFEPPPTGASIGRTMGLAVANPSPASVDVRLNLVDTSGGVLATHAFSLAPFGQAALDLQQLDSFRTALPPTNFLGSITAAATAPVCALALIDNYGPFLTAPIVRKSK